MIIPLSVVVRMLPGERLENSWIRGIIYAIARYLNKKPQEIQLTKFRPPTKPVPLGVLANEAGEKHE